MISMIAAVGRSLELGANGDLIWHLPSDMRFFREKTTGHTIIMGRKTFESFPKPLPNRHHVVITHKESDLFPEGVDVIGSFEEAYMKYRDSTEEIFIIGGGQIYEEFYPYADRMYLTHVDDTQFTADTYFPEIVEEDWTITELMRFEEEGQKAVVKQYDRKPID